MGERTGGIHSATAALGNALAHAGVGRPDRDEPLSEALILGIGGGLGAGYILWEFEVYDTALIVLGFRNRWNYTADFLQNACQRLNVTVDLRETGGVKKAQANLDEALERSGTALLWTDKASLPYQQLPEAMKGHLLHVIRASAGAGGAYRVDDLCARPFSLSGAEMRAARQPIPSNKQRSLCLTGAGSLDLPGAILAGIQDHVAHLSRSSASFSLPVYKKWSKLMTHERDKKSWRLVFAGRAGLYLTLRTINEGIRLDESDGAGLRALYADFLDEAHAILPQDLAGPAAAYRDCAATWRDFADLVLCDDVPAFAETKALMHARYDAYARQDAHELKRAMDQLTELEAPNNLAGFPLDDRATDALFQQMAEQLAVIYDVEGRALTQLKNAIA